MSLVPLYRFVQTDGTQRMFLWPEEPHLPIEGTGWVPMGLCGYCEDEETSETTAEMTLLSITIEGVRFHYIACDQATMDNLMRQGWSDEGSLGWLLKDGSSLFHLTRTADGLVTNAYSTLATENLLLVEQGFVLVGAIGSVVPSTLELLVDKGPTPLKAICDHTGEPARMSYGESIQVQLNSGSFDANARITRVDFFEDAGEKTVAATFDVAAAGIMPHDVTVGDAGFRIWATGPQSVRIMDNQPAPVEERAAWYKVYVAEGNDMWVLDPELINKGGGRGGGPSWGGRR
jgi:hypothetical protein